MLKRITLTRHETVESWNSWIVAVPDDMDDERIEELMKEAWENRELDLDEEEREDAAEPSVDIGEAPVAATTPHLTLTENGLVDEETAITAFTTELLQAELERRRAKECDTIVV
jgi:coenzyme F420-reducing hydrogenase alpha subunit